MGLLSIFWLLSFDNGSSFNVDFRHDGISVMPGRREPGKKPEYKLASDIKPATLYYKTGDTVNIELEIVNEGDGPINYYQSGIRLNPTGRNDDFRFNIYRNDTLIVDCCDGHRFEFDEGGAVLSLQPGEHKIIKESLSNWCKFDKPGLYRIECFYTLKIYFDSDGYNFHYKGTDDLPGTEIITHEISIEVE
jgi:hypothetical protein